VLLIADRINFVSPKSGSVANLIGPTLQRLKTTLSAIAESPFSTATVICGEKGTGKTLLLEHFTGSLSNEMKKTIINHPVNDQILTDSIGGWLIIDNMEHITKHQQQVIAKMIEEKQLKFIATATNFYTQIDGNLRAGLKGNKLSIAPLRERKKEIQQLVRFFSGTFLVGYEISVSVKRILRTYSFKTENISELIAVLKDAKDRTRTNIIDQRHLPEELILSCRRKRGPAVNSELVDVTIQVNLKKTNFKDACNLLLVELTKALTERNRLKFGKSNSFTVAKQLKFSRSTMIERFEEMGYSKSKLKKLMKGEDD